MANKQAMEDIARNVSAIVLAGKHPALFPLINDRYHWPIQIVAHLIRSPEPIKGVELITQISLKAGITPIGQPYLRDLISALRAGGAPIRSVRGVGYWWQGD